MPTHSRSSSGEATSPSRDRVALPRFNDMRRQHRRSLSSDTNKQDSKDGPPSSTSPSRSSNCDNPLIVRSDWVSRGKSSAEVGPLSSSSKDKVTQSGLQESTWHTDASDPYPSSPCIVVTPVVEADSPHFSPQTPTSFHDGSPSHEDSTTYQTDVYGQHQYQDQPQFYSGNRTDNHQRAASLPHPGFPSSTANNADSDQVHIEEFRPWWCCLTHDPAEALMKGYSAYLSCPEHFHDQSLWSPDQERISCLFTVSNLGSVRPSDPSDWCSAYNFWRADADLQAGNQALMALESEKQEVVAQLMMKDWWDYTNQCPRTIPVRESESDKIEGGLRPGYTRYGSSDSGEESFRRARSEGKLPRRRGGVLPSIDETMAGDS